MGAQEASWCVQREAGYTHRGSGLSKTAGRSLVQFPLREPTGQGWLSAQSCLPRRGGWGQPGNLGGKGASGLDSVVTAETVTGWGWPHT